MDWDEVKRIYYYRKMLGGKFRVFVREERLSSRIRDLGWEINSEEKAAKLINELSVEGESEIERL